MSNWQAPTTQNERDPGDVGATSIGTVRPYLDATTGHVKWWASMGALPVGATLLYIVERVSDHRRVFSTDAANSRKPLLFGTHVYIR